MLRETGADLPSAMEQPAKLEVLREVKVDDSVLAGQLVLAKRYDRRQSNTTSN